MSKKDALRSRMINRPALKRTKPVEETKLDEAVRAVSDNPPPVASPVTTNRVGEAEKQQQSSTVKKSATTSKTANKKPVSKSGKSAKKEGPASAKRVGQKSAAPPLKRLTLDLSQDLHQKVKLHSLQKGMSMREWILGVIERELSK